MLRRPVSLFSLGIKTEPSSETRLRDKFEKIVGDRKEKPLSKL